MAKRRRAAHPAEHELAVWDILRRRGLWGLATFLACLTPFVSVVSFLPDVYRSTATVLIERQQIPDELVRSTVTSALETRLHTITQQILSRPQLEELYARFGLGDEAGPGRLTDRVIDRIRDSIQVELETSKVRRDHGAAAVAFTVSYSGRDPEKAALVANALALSYVEENLRMRKQEAAGTADFLRQQLETTKRNLEEQEKQVSAFKERYSGQLPEQLSANLATLEQLNVQLRLNSENQISASERRAALVKQLSEAEGMAPAGGPDAAGNRLLQLRQTLAVLQARYSDKYPDVVRVKSEIESLESELRRASTGEGQQHGTTPEANPLTFQLRQAIDAVDVEIKRLKAEQENLRGSLAQYQNRVEMAPRREQESQALVRDYETNKELYRSLVTRERESQLAQEMEQRRKGEQFRVIEPALPPGAPAAPRRRTLTLAAVPGALVLAILAMALVEFLDSSLHSAQDLQRLTTIPIVASIPRITVEADRRQRRRRLGLAAASAVGVLVAIVAASYAVAANNLTLTRLLLRLSS
jgi:polysaccharide chain length determinant protein (PEP-CTERM system associated)